MSRLVQWWLINGLLAWCGYMFVAHGWTFGEGVVTFVLSLCVFAYCVLALSVRMPEYEERMTLEQATKMLSPMPLWFDALYDIAMGAFYAAAGLYGWAIMSGIILFTSQYIQVHMRKIVARKYIAALAAREATNA